MPSTSLAPIPSRPHLLSILQILEAAFTDRAFAVSGILSAWVSLAALLLPTSSFLFEFQKSHYSSFKEAGHSWEAAYHPRCQRLWSGRALPSSYNIICLLAEIKALHQLAPGLPLVNMFTAIVVYWSLLPWFISWELTNPITTGNF